MSMKFKINFTQANIGDHQERYQHLDCFSFSCDSISQAFEIVSDKVAECERDVDSCDLWWTDTCVANCTYLLDQNDELTDICLCNL